MQKILGSRLKKSREDLGLTQEELGKAVGLSSEFISHLELGRRTPSLQTLTLLGDYFKKDICYFLVKEETAFNSLLESGSLDETAKKAVRKFQKYCEEYLRLEKLVERRLELAPAYHNISPQRMAEEERSRLGLGSEPIADVFSLLEQNGCRLFRSPIPEDSRLPGIFIYLETEDAAFALVNSLQDPAQQVMTAVHEYCHYLKDRDQGPVVDSPDFFIQEYVSLYHPRERFAQAFSTHFLMPASKIRDIIGKDARSGRLSVEDVLYLKRYFRVGALAMIYTLRNLGYVSQAELLEYRGSNLEELEKSVFGNIIPDTRILPHRGGQAFSDRFVVLAVEAHQKKKIDDTNLSRLLRQRTGRKKSGMPEAGTET